MDFLLTHSASFVYGLVVFVVFVLVLIPAVLKPAAQAIAARDERIKAQLNEAEQAYDRARELKTQLDQQLAGAEVKIQEMIREGRRDAEATKASIIADGRKEVDAIRVRAQREIEAARYEAVVALRQEVAEIATQVAGTILDERLDPQRHQELVGAAIEAFESQHGGTA